MSHRQHGTRAKYVIDKCRCDDCRRANREYRNAADRQIAYGRWQPYIDAAPTRERIEQLRAAGMGTRRIADAAGIGRTAIMRIAQGERARIRTETAEAIAAMPLTPGGAALTSSDGTHQRIAALVAGGWTHTTIAGRLGMTRSNYWAMRQRPQVTYATARTVLALYAEHLAALDRRADSEAGFVHGEWIKDRAGVSRLVSA